jgi:hypothetical protein
MGIPSAAVAIAPRPQVSNCIKVRRLAVGGLEVELVAESIARESPNRATLFACPMIRRFAIPSKERLSVRFAPK